MEARLEVPIGTLYVDEVNLILGEMMTGFLDGRRVVVLETWGTHDNDDKRCRHVLILKSEKVLDSLVDQALDILEPDR